MRYAVDVGDGERRIVDVRDRPDLGEGMVEATADGGGASEPLYLRLGPGNEFVADLGGRIVRGLYDRTPSGITLHLGAARREFTIDREAAPVARARPAADGVVRAPMPGRVLRVLVALGDSVAAGQGVAVVEAMKMENEVVSPHAGRVTEVRAVAGRSVEAGEPLITVAG